LIIKHARKRKPPERVGKYLIEREIGQGATGIVYLAMDTFRKRQVAVKMADEALLADVAGNVRLRRVLQTEAGLVGRLKHPHIVALLDADIEAERPYVVMEFVDGVSLDTHISPSTLLPVREVLDITFQCCGALDFAWRWGELVHRDIKPANMLRPKTGGMKLADFGAAMVFNAAHTQLTGFVGSPAYMSPEQIREEKLTPQSDMFSLGVVLYQLLTGSLPFEGETDFATIYKINYEEPEPPSLRRPGLGRDVDEVIGRALSKRAEHRYANWKEFADAISAIGQEPAAMEARPSDRRLFLLLRGMPFLAGFPDAAIWELLDLGVPYRVNAGSIMMREEHPGTSFYLLLDGEVTISRKGRELAVLKPGVTLGEMIYLRPNLPLRTATATAASDLTVLKITCEALRNASESLQGYFDKAFIHLLVDRLTDTNQRLTDAENSTAKDA